jgi:hypothetical protein
LNTTTATVASYKSLVLAAAKTDTLRKGIVARFDKLRAQLKQAEKETDDTTLIRVFQTALKAEINHITKALYELNTAQVLLNEVREDEEFVSKRIDEVAKVAHVVAGNEKTLTEKFRQAKALENEAEEALKNAFASPAESFRKLAWMDKNVDESKKFVEAQAKKVHALQDKADAAAAAGDARALEQAQGTLRDLGLADLGQANGIFFKFAGDFLNEIKTLNYSVQVMAELTDGATDLLKEAKGTQGLVESLQDIGKNVLALSVDAIDAKKALKVLGLDTKHLARLTKALSVPKAELERALDVMVRELKLATTGRQMLDVLHQGGVVPR